MTETLSGTQTSEAPQSITQQFVGVQMQLLEAGDTEGLAARYAEDAEFVRFDRVARGRAEIKQLFDDYVKDNPQLTGLDAIQITDDVILYQAPEYIRGTLTSAVGYIAFKGDLVWRQSVAFVACRPGDIVRNENVDELCPVSGEVS